jgi:hypothetical protein
LFEGDEEGAMVAIDCGASAKPSQVASVIGLLKNCGGNIDTETSKLSDADMNKYLCAEERRDILKCIANGTLVGGEDEQSILRILKTTPLNQKSKLVDLLAATPNLLYKLHSSIDGDELAQYYIELLNLYGLSKDKAFWIAETKRFDGIEKSVPKRTLKEWSDNKVFFWLDNGLIDFITEGRIKYDKEKINSDNSLTFDFYNNVGLMPILTQSVKDIKLQPFETVRVYFFSDSEELSIGKGQKIDMPAIALRLLIQKQFNREIWNSINTAFVFGTLGSGSLVTLWGKVDLFLGLGALLEDNYRADLRKTEEGRIVLEAWKYLNYALLARLGYQVTKGIPEAWKSLNAAIARLKAKNPTLAQSVEAEAKLAFGEYVNAADDLVKGAGKTLATSGDELLALGRNIFKGSDEMLQAAKTKIADYRIAMKGKQKLGGNLGYVEGEINGLKLDDGLVSSVAEDLNASKIFEAKYVNSANEIKLSKTDGAWLRTGDSEFQMITQKIAQRFNLEQGKVYTQYTGTVKIVSELPYCASCSGVIHQVSEMLPNVKFIIVNGAK